jgi:ABC-2 type transport system ATP-binding protein
VRGLRGEERRRRVAEVLAACALEEVGQQGISTLSKGFRQRVCFAQSILHDPPYLILDEPTDGLDPNQKHEVRSMIRRMAARKAIILSSHILDEVDALCTRAIIIARGRIVADDTPEGLRARAATHGAVTLQADPRDREALLQTLSALPGIKRVQPLDPPEPGLRVQVLPVAPNPALAGEVLAALSARQITIQALATERGRLEEVFRALTAPESTGAHAAAPGEGQPERNPQ